MGEGSAKSLRGENMKDVIFAGSQMRAPMNHAEVELVFDNRDHQLASENDEVVVTRKILRNGESDYLLNHHPVRLKDVRTLFIESGMSSDSLGIISQGRSMKFLILSHNSVEEFLKRLPASFILSSKKKLHSSN